MNLSEFSQANLARCEAPNGFNHPLQSWSTSDWFVAIVGELGEAANIVKKLNRVRDGVPGNKQTPEELRRKLALELADTFIYLDLICQREGVDLSRAVAEAFNAKSREIGYGVEFNPEPNLNPELGPEHREYWLNK
jgi:NTP pyrophosphatase (non-canonical NTP hydrolase)